MSEFKIGDRVRVVGRRLFENSSMGKEGLIFEFRNGDRPHIRFDDGTTDWGRADELELVTPKSTFKIGDLVKINPEAAVTYVDHVEAQREGKTGDIFGKDYQGSWRVRWNDGRTSSRLTNDMLMPAEATPTIPDEITVNGEKYRRVVDDKPEEPKKPEPKAGQVWRDSLGDIVHLRRVGDRMYQAVGLTTNNQYWGEPRRHVSQLMDNRGNWTFVADSLADALENGKITPADLRR